MLGEVGDRTTTTVYPRPQGNLGHCMPIFVTAGHPGAAILYTGLGGFAWGGRDEDCGARGFIQISFLQIVGFLRVKQIFIQTIDCQTNIYSNYILAFFRIFDCQTNIYSNHIFAIFNIFECQTNIYSKHIFANFSIFECHSNSGIEE